MRENLTRKERLKEFFKVIHSPEKSSAYYDSPEGRVPTPDYADRLKTDRNRQIHEKGWDDICFDMVATLKSYNNHERLGDSIEGDQRRNCRIKQRIVDHVRSSVESGNHR